MIRKFYDLCAKIGQVKIPIWVLGLLAFACIGLIASLGLAYLPIIYQFVRNW